MTENEIYRRTWPQRLADAAPYAGLLLVTLAPVWTYDLRATPLWVGMFLSGAALVALGVERSAHYRGQRDRYRRSLVALVTKVEIDQTRDYFAHLVPADVLAEALPKPTPASPRPVSEGCGSNHREVGDE